MIVERSADCDNEIVGQTPDDGACGRCLAVAESEHRIANHLALLAGYARIHARALLDPQGRTALNGLALQIDSMGRLHRLLMRGGDGRADIGLHLQQVVESIVETFGPAVVISQEVSGDCRIAQRAVLPVTQIVVEAMTNALKYGGAAESARITLQCVHQDGGTIIRVSDNGPGLQTSLSPKGSGFRMMESLAEQAGARLSYLSEGGFMIQIELPSLF